MNKFIYEVIMVMCVSYLKLKKARAFLKGRKCVRSKRDAKEARRGGP